MSEENSPPLESRIYPTYDVTLTPYGQAFLSGGEPGVTKSKPKDVPVGKTEVMTSLVCNFNKDKHKKTIVVKYIFMPERVV